MASKKFKSEATKGKRAEEKLAKKSKASKAEEKPAKKKKREEAVETTPKKKVKKEKIAEISSKDQRRLEKMQQAAAEAKAAAKKRGKENEAAKKAVADLFNPLANIDETLDGIEKDYGLTGSSLGQSEERLSTGFLELDVVIGGGLLPGWYTNFGAEQSCKSTGATTMMISALFQDVPIIAYWDYEGCFTLNAKLKTNLGEITGAELLAHFGVDPIQTTEKKFIDVEGLEVETLGQMVKVDKLYFSGVRPTTIITTEAGRTFEGYKHPMLCLNSEGDLVYKNLEDLVAGDKVVVKTSTPNVNLSA